MNYLRKLRIAIPLAAALTLGGLAAGTPTASALRAVGNPCGSYIYNYQWWGSEYVSEVEGAGYETPYAVYAYSRIRDYGDLIQAYGC
jgi:hypothetical protein